MVDVRQTEDASRFEAVVDGVVAGQIELRTRGDVVELIHTSVGSGYEGRGIASQLVRVASDHVRASGLRIAPVCSYATAWLDRHPDYDDIRA